MAQTSDGAIKCAATKAGISVEEYVANIESGLKRCTRCKRWSPLDLFGNDKSRGDGKDATCFDCRRVKEPQHPWRGGHLSQAHRQKIAKALKQRYEARKHPLLGKESPKKGRPRTTEERNSIRAGVLRTQKYGEKHPNYSHGNSQRNRDARRTPEYRVWREAVFERDNYTCQKCGDKQGGNLRAHHIKSFAKHPELRFDVSNGLTLCHTCHELQHYKPDSIRNERKRKRGESLWE